MTTFNVQFESLADSFNISFQDNDSISVDFESVVNMAKDNPYTGSYTFTPSQEEQTIEIQGKTASENIVIAPIPSCYGLVTYNGTTLTVS